MHRVENLFIMYLNTNYLCQALNGHLKLTTQISIIIKNLERTDDTLANIFNDLKYVVINDMDEKIFILVLQ